MDTEEQSWLTIAPHRILVISLFNNAVFVSVGPYEQGGVAMNHKKAGNEEAARRPRTNLKDVHWYVAFVLCLWHKTVLQVFLPYCTPFKKQRPSRSIYVGSRRKYFVISCYTIASTPEEKCQRRSLYLVSVPHSKTIYKGNCCLCNLSWDCSDEESAV